MLRRRSYLTVLPVLFGGGLNLVVAEYVSVFCGVETVLGYVVRTPKGLRRRWLR